MGVPPGMDRRYLIAGAAGGVTAAVGATIAAVKLGYVRRIPVIGPEPDHLIEVRNEREQSHEVTVEYDIDGTGLCHGPWRIKPGEIWGVRSVRDLGTLSLTVTVDGEEELEDSHEVPLQRSGSSAVVITLRESGFLTSRIEDRRDDEY